MTIESLYKEVTAEDLTTDQKIEVMTALIIEQASLRIKEGLDNVTARLPVSPLTITNTKEPAND